MGRGSGARWSDGILPAETSPREPPRNSMLATPPQRIPSIAKARSPRFRRSFIRDCRRICQFQETNRRRSCCAAKTIDREFPKGFPQLFIQLKHAGVPAELHVYTGVGHGFGIRSANTGAIAGWPDHFLEWRGDPRLPEAQIEIRKAQGPIYRQACALIASLTAAPTAFKLGRRISSYSRETTMPSAPASKPFNTA